MILQALAICAITACAILFGVGILRFILAWHRLSLYQQEAEFRAQCLLAESAMQLRGRRSTRGNTGSESSATGLPSTPPPPTLHPAKPLFDDAGARQAVMRG